MGMYEHSPVSLRIKEHMEREAQPFLLQAQGFADLLPMGAPCEDPPSKPTEL